MISLAQAIGTNRESGERWVQKQTGNHSGTPNTTLGKHELWGRMNLFTNSGEA